MTQRKLSLSKLNPAQREAVLHAQGPLLILAGAGSGKTSTMTYRIAHLIAERGVSSGSILGLSFTNRAAGELRDRVKDLIKSSVGIKATQGLTICTFHSFCVRVLREYADRLGYAKTFNILDDSDQLEILRKILKNLHIDDRKFDPSWILFQMGQMKNRLGANSKDVAQVQDGDS